MNLQVSNQTRSNTILFHNVNSQVARGGNCHFRVNLAAEDAVILPPRSVLVGRNTILRYKDYSYIVVERIIAESRRKNCIRLNDGEIAATKSSFVNRC